MKALILNADDFGLRAVVNRRVVEGFREGLLTSTSLLSNTPAAAEALALARRHTGLEVGIHLNLSRGAPAAPAAKVRSLLGRDGCFPPTVGALLWRRARARMRDEEVRVEWEAQIAKVVDAGVRPTHLDGHHHVHLLPGLLPLALALARRFAIPWVRVPGRLPHPPSRRTPVSLAKWGWIGLQARRGQALMAGLDRCDTFIELPAGLGRPEAYSRMLFRIVRSLPEGLTELACHPGYAGPDPAAEPMPGPDPELEALADPGFRAELQRLDVRILGRQRARA